MLVPIDLTPSSDRPLGRLMLLPLADDARVTLLHVVPDNIPRDLQRSAESDACVALAEDARHLRESLPRTVRVETLVTVGSAARDIGGTAKKVRAKLIVMGRGGARPWRDAFLGSTAERVARGSQLPVLVVRLRPRAAYRRPALALDLDQAADEAVRLLLLVLAPPRPRVDVIHAYDIPFKGLIYPSLSDDEAQRTKDQLKLAAAREMTELLGGAIANVPAHDVPAWKTHVSLGPPRLVVEKAIDRLRTDLLVLGTHARAGAAFAFLGSVAGDILREAKCDVLLVPPVD